MKDEIKIKGKWKERKLVINVFYVSRMSGQVPKLGLIYWKLTLHLINVAEINAQQYKRDLN